MFWSFRLFYAGACEGQMPEILTMIQVSRLTPTPAVLVIALLSLFYLVSDNVFILINYVGFATWVNDWFTNIKNLFENKNTNKNTNKNNK